jgi:hypothetical protein
MPFSAGGNEMNRSLILFALALSAVGVGCNNPVCGPGTKQHQKSNGDVECVPVDMPASGIPCDADAGATIVAGQCVSAITCGPNTKLSNGVCVGTGGGGNHVPPACDPPAADKICINGVVRHLIDNSFLAPGEMVRVAVYNPLAFLNDPTTGLLKEAETDDTYLFTDIAIPPTLPLIAVAVGDPTGTTMKMLQLTGTGAVVTLGQSYEIDTYITPASLVTTWTSQVGGAYDYDMQGAYVIKYYLDMGPSPNMLTATETMPADSVQVVENGTVSTRAKYFTTDLMTIGSGTSTGAIGAALLTGNGNPNNNPLFSGLGNTPANKWETHPGNSTGHVVFVDRFHPCKQDTNGNCTN